MPHCSMDSLEPAPTEEGFYVGAHIEKVLSELKEQDGAPLPPKRWSRSFSEPNLYMHFLMQARAPKPCLARLSGACWCSDLGSRVQSPLCMRAPACELLLLGTGLYGWYQRLQGKEEQSVPSCCGPAQSLAF